MNVVRSIVQPAANQTLRDVADKQDPDQTRLVDQKDLIAPFEMFH